MKKTLIGITSFGGIRFLELALRSLQETITEPNVDFLVVVAKPGDQEMIDFCVQRNFRTIVHHENMGFPASCNDILDAAFVDGDYANVIFMGNDVVAMPGAIDTMIQRANEESPYGIFCASEFNARFLYDNYPEARQFFDGPNLIFNDFTARPWELHKDYRENTIEPDTLKDIRNLTLFKKEAFEIVGYDDPGFFPNGYFADNDLARRCNLLGIRAAGLPSAGFFHFWSRTIHQGEDRQHDKYFIRNRELYGKKWGSETWMQETFAVPFDGKPHRLSRGKDLVLPATLDIPDRDQERAVIEHWRNL